MKGMMIFIPARGGSKGIPGKNLVPLAGTPLIGHTLRLVKQALAGSPVLISTDCKKISVYCKKMGFESEYRRPRSLAGDRAPLMGAVWHGLRWMEDRRRCTFTDILVLQPTSPLREPMEIKRALKMYQRGGLTSLVSVVPMREHPYECLEKTPKRGWKFLRKPAHRLSRRQEYKKNYFFIDGSFYMASKKFLQKHGRFVVEGKSFPWVRERRWEVDIDEPEDLTVAEALIRKRR